MSSVTSHFSCDSCRISIDVAHPRIHCLVCRDFDLCANCAIGEKLPYGHLPEHTIEIYKEGGRPRSSGAVISQVTISYVSRNLQPLPSWHASLSSIQSHRGPPPPIPPRPNVSSASSATSVQQETLLAQTGWEPFFLPDMTPTLTYTTLANEIFTYLDPRNVGILVPETLSQFLDDMGYPLNENYWKNGSTASLGTPDLDMSILSDRDKALKDIFELFAIEHHLLPRPSAPQCLPTMPAITRKGFVDITSIDLLTEPSRQWEYMNHVLRKYNLPIYQRWGGLPRSVLPPVPEQAMVDRVANAGAIAKSKQQEAEGGKEQKAEGGKEGLSAEDQLDLQLRMIQLQSRLASMRATSQSFSNHLLTQSLNTMRF